MPRSSASGSASSAACATGRSTTHAPPSTTCAGRTRSPCVTNGASCLQREKLAGSGLSEDDFDVVVISGDLGVGKPEPAIFVHTLSQLGVTADGAVMIGDSMERDIDGAAALGIRGIWLNRDGAAAPSANGHLQISTLADVAGAIAGLSSPGRAT